MTEEILAKMDKRKQAKNTPEYAQIDREIRRNCRKEKETWCNKKCAEIEESQKLNATKKMHDSIKELAGNSKSSKSGGSCIKDKEGNMIFEREKILERWAEYIGDLFSDT